MKRTRYVLLAAAVFVLLVVLLRRTPVEQRAEVSKTNTLPVAAQVPTNEMSAPMTESESNRVSVPPILISELNRFITSARPYGLDRLIQTQDVVYFTNSHKTHMIVQTKTHIATFFDYKLNQLLATYDSSNPVAEPERKREAQRQWYQATAKWSREEALAETQRIMQALGIGGVQWESTNVEPFTLAVKNPQGEQITVTPFYTVKLDAPHNTLRAEFRMGESGPGRLTDWFAWPPLPNLR